MNICEMCKKHHNLFHKKSKKPLKYCSNKCSLKKCHENRYNNIEKRNKHNAEEKKRYWEKHGIKSIDDLKCAPKGTGCITKNGYKRITKHNHANAAKKGAIFEHVYIMSEFLGRPLSKQERVHHKNGIRSDNRLENLELWSHSQPYGQRVDDKIKWCKEFLENYGLCVIKKENINESK